MNPEKKEKNLLPGAILVSAVLISAALIYNVGAKNVDRGAQLVDNAPSLNTSGSIRLVDKTDWIFGDPDAPVKIVEYSDLECPFCKSFHQTMKQMMQEYEGRVAWVYRHFPLDSIHPKAPYEAAATECAGELGGNTAFWQYVDSVFEITPSNNGLNLALLPQIAESIGLNKTEFQACLDSGRHNAEVEADFNEAVAVGGRGTPYSVVVAENGKEFPITGALPITSVRSVIEQALRASK